MKSLPVHWYEGLFLRPHHLQAADRYWAEQQQTSQQWNLPYHYGLHSLVFSEEALGNHQFEIQKLQARMRDGTIVDLGHGEEPDRLDLKESIRDITEAMAPLADAFDVQSVVRIYLAIPKLKLGRTNVGSSGGEVDPRYRFARSGVQDENQGGCEEEIEFRELNVRLLLSTQDLSGYELLPIAQIKRAGDGEAIPQLDRSYIPPVMSVDAWPGLSRDMIRAIYDIIGQKIEVLSEQVNNRGIGLETRDPGDVDRVAMLQRLNEAYATLGAIVFVKGLHPLTAYTELCRILGQLSIFSTERRTSEIPPYDHEDLQPVFLTLKRRIEQIINSVRDYKYQQRYFVGVGMGMQVSLEPQWFNSDWQWFIGVRKGDLSDQECRELLSSGHLDWKLGSSRQVEILFKRRAQGLQLRLVDRAIRALPTRKDWMFYEVLQNESAAWRDVHETQTLAMRLKDSLIVNLDRLQGEQTLVVSAQGKKATLQFALFAIPSHQQ